MMIRNPCKRLFIAVLSLLVLGLASCGGSSGTSGSHLAVRAFVTDDTDGTIHVENAQEDLESGFTISVGNRPGPMAVSPDKSFTMVFDAGANNLAIVTNATEAVTGNIALPFNSTPQPNPPGGNASYIVVSDTVGFAAVHSLNQIEVLGFTFPNGPFVISQAINVSHPPTSLIISGDAKKMLVFSAPGDQQTSFSIIDLTSTSFPVTPVTSPDHPVWGVFSADNSKAFILNCGPECGGTTASVSVLDLASGTITSTVPVVAASVGALVNNTLFVAGTPNGTLGVNHGKLTPVDVGTLTPGTPVNIGDGYHHLMQLVSNNKLFIGAMNCTNDPNTAGTGCLTIFDVSQSKTDLVSAAITTPGSLGVTGIAQIGQRNAAYVVERGELRIYNTSGTAALTPQQIDVAGTAMDVKYLGP